MKKNKLQKSLDKFFSKDFYAFMIERYPDRTDYEFGTWDYFWLVNLLAFWIKVHHEKKTGINGLFNSEREQDAAYRELINGFLKLSDLDVDECGDYDQLMNRFKELLPTMWD